MNLATLLEGPANVTHRGQTFHFKGGLTLTPIAEAYAIDTDLYGPVDLRALDNTFVLSGVPVGVWTAAQLAVLYRWTNPQLGSLVTPRYDVSAVTHGSETITLVGSAVPRTGCPVQLAGFPGAVAPNGWTFGTLYYWGAAGTLHATEAHALAASNAVTISDNGSGDMAIIEQETLVIDAITANRRITFHNGAVIGMPAISHSPVASMLGAVTFGAFRTNDTAWSGANSVYTVAKAALSDTPPTAADILTQEYSLAFGSSPWDSFKSRGPITMTPSLQTEPIISDGRGTVGLKITGVGASVSFQPQGFSEAQMLDLLAVQGGSVARGKTRVRGNVVITGTGVHNIVYNAAPRQLPQTFASNSPRAGELEAVGVATPGSARFYVGTAAP